MNDYYVFLRGINVGGNKKVPMGDLKKLLESNGYTGVRTFLNSGNVRLAAKESKPDTLEKDIETLLEKSFGFPVPAVSRKAQRMEQLFSKNPFDGQTEDKKLKWMVTFLKKPVGKHPEMQEVEGYEVISRENDLVGGVLDLNKAGSVDVMAVLEKAYGKEITTRTWQTLVRMTH